ncbi:hypothetical protein L7F22_058444 [Adiantum nelumboides]|nr:hypothetical protein [Adiantum nelumboides]
MLWSSFALSLRRSSNAENAASLLSHFHSRTYFRFRWLHGTASFEQLVEGTSPIEAYHRLVQLGGLRSDSRQVEALQPLERLHKELKDYSPPSLPSKGFASRLLHVLQALKKPTESPRGVYIYGGVGTGKSLVADIFYYCSPVKSKRRVHFHQFMLDVHRRLHETRLKGKAGKSDDIMKAVAEEILSAGWLLCFDEFQVLDIADAMILKRLLESLFQSGAVMVASSNRSPTELYKNGLQRELFLPCIESIKKHCEVQSFHPESPDYRLIGARPDGTSALSVVWYKPLNMENETLFERTFNKLAGERIIESTILKSGLRSIEVPRAAGGIAFFNFNDLCGTPKGASDYLAIATSFHTIFLANIPQMTSSHNELARRFITLVDVLYEQKVKLIASASVNPQDLYKPSLEDVDILKPAAVSANEQPKKGQAPYEEKDEEFAFARTVSRLTHMQSLDYLSAPWASPGKDFICHLQKSRLQEGDVQRIWDRYNVDSDSRLSRSELMLMMEDLTEIKSGHRNVPEEILDHVFTKLDANGDGIIVWTEFRDYVLQYGLEIYNV